MTFIYQEIEEEEREEEKKQEEGVSEALDLDRLADLSTRELRQHLKRLGQIQTGVKETLVQRLRSALKRQSALSSPPPTSLSLQSSIPTVSLISVDAKKREKREREVTDYDLFEYPGGYKLGGPPRCICGRARLKSCPFGLCHYCCFKREKPCSEHLRRQSERGKKKKSNLFIQSMDLRIVDISKIKVVILFL